MASTPASIEVRLEPGEGGKVLARTFVGHPGLAEGDLVTVRIATREPGAQAPGPVRTFKLPYRRDMRIIDLLHALSDAGESVAYRWFCSTKKCGGCGMKVNGQPKLVCWEPVEGTELLIEPLDNFDTVRDLVVDRTGYQERVRALKPYVKRDQPPSFPEEITHRDMLGPYQLMDCIECGICTSTCPAYTGENGVFPGPWALVQAAKFARDPRDRENRTALIEGSGVDHCMSCYRCEQVCPVSIPIVTEAIEPLRGIAARGPTRRASHPLTFARNLRRNALVHSPTLFWRSHGLLGVLRRWPLALAMLMLGKVRLTSAGTARGRAATAALFLAAGEEEID